MNINNQYLNQNNGNLTIALVAVVNTRQAF